MRIERLLQRAVQRLGAGRSAVHRREDLNIAQRIESKDLGDALLDHADSELSGARRVVAADHVEVGALVTDCADRELPVENPVGVLHDPGPLRLTKDLGQASDGNGARFDDVGQDPPRPNGGELVDVADEEHA